MWQVGWLLWLAEVAAGAAESCGRAAGTLQGQCGVDARARGCRIASRAQGRAGGQQGCGEKLGLEGCTSRRASKRLGAATVLRRRISFQVFGFLAFVV